MELDKIPGYHNLVSSSYSEYDDDEDYDDESEEEEDDDYDEDGESEPTLPTYTEPESSYNLRTARFKDAPWYNKFYDITVGGAGGIGGILTLLLSRLGHKMTVWDFDHIEDINLGGQCYTVGDVGKYKVDALKELATSFSGEHNVIGKRDKITSDSIIESICFSCFDNMESRKNLFDSWCEEAMDNQGDIPCIFIDGRLLYGNMQIYVVTKDNIDKYKETLFEDSEVVRENCSLKVTTHYAYMIAAYMVSMLTNYLTNYVVGYERAALPFSIKLELTSMYYEYSY